MLAADWEKSAASLHRGRKKMQYRKDKYGNELSALGYGCMRFTKSGGNTDLDKAEREIKAAVEAGVNYFDTAYVYAGNEAAVGTIFRRLGCREQVHIATKLPHYLIKSMDGVERMFEEELKRLQTDYIDYYLMHMLTDIPTWEKLKKLGMEDWIREKRHPDRSGRLDFPIMVIRRCSVNCSMPMTGISARFSIIIWMSIRRQV